MSGLCESGMLILVTDKTPKSTPPKLQSIQEKYVKGVPWYSVYMKVQHDADDVCFSKF